MDVIDPATDEVIESYEERSPSEVDEMLETATTAFETWRRRPLADRERLLASADSALRFGPEPLRSGAGTDRVGPQ